MENENGVMVLGIILAVFAFLLIVYKLAEFFTEFNRDTRYIFSEIKRAGDYSEYRYWRRELRCHYLCLIPFVTERNVMRLYNRIYHRPKHAENKKRSDKIYHILASSVIGACICAVCLCGASWAWFTASISTGITKIQAAAYSVSVAAKEGETEVTAKAAEGGASAFELEADKEYKIEITPTGNAKNGYCKVDFEETVYYTKQLTSGMLSFTVYASKDGKLTITPQWGSCAIEGQRIGNGEKDLKTLGTKPTDSTTSDTKEIPSNPATSETVAETTVSATEQTQSESEETAPDTVLTEAENTSGTTE